MTLLGHEREMLGLYVSDHPLLGLEHVLSNGTDCTIGQLMLDEERPDGSTLTISGLVTSVQRKITKRGDAWATVTLEDLDGAIEVLLFPERPTSSPAPTSSRTRSSRSRAGSPATRTSPSSGQEVTVPDLTDGPSRAGRDQPAGHPVHPAGRRAAQGRPRHPPRRDRGAAAAADASGRSSCVGRRPAGHAEPGTLRRPQAAAGSRMPDRMTARPTPRRSPCRAGVVLGARRGGAGRSPGSLGVVVDAASGIVYGGERILEPSGPDYDFSGIGWYVVIALVARPAALAAVLAGPRGAATATTRRRRGGLGAGRLADVHRRPQLGPPDPRPALAAGRPGAVPSDLGGPAATRTGRRPCTSAAPSWPSPWAP